MSLSKAAVGGCLVVVLALPSAHASVVVSNLGEQYQVGITSDGAHFAAAGSFTTSAAGTYKLNSVSLPIQVNSPSGDTTELRLRANNAGAPGTLLESLGSLFAPQGQTSLTYNSSIHSLLSPNTTYWLTLGETGSGGGQNWDGTFSNNETSPIGWTIGDEALDSANGGVTWGPVNTPPPNETPKFAVDASLVPEPSTALLAIAAVGTALLLVRNRRTALERLR
jgi:hypothetical protein